PPPPAPPPRERRAARAVLFNDNGFRFGAGIAHERIARALALAGHETTALFPADPRAAPPSVEGVIQAIAALDPDGVVVGNLHALGADTPLLSAIAARWPTLFVLHDQWLMTGRCAYVGPCRDYLEQCGPSCPTAGEYPSLAPGRIGDHLRRHRELLAGEPLLSLAANSRWMGDFVDEALAHPPSPRRTGRGPTPVIRFGLDFNVFRPRDRQTVRAALGLPPDRFLLITSAADLRDPRKGLGDLLEALRLADLDDLLLVCLGWSDAPPTGSRIVHTGYLESPEEVACYYAAGDLFVGPSRQEAFGQVFVEAAACGLPSVGYPLGGVREAIQHGVTGLLAPGDQPADLAEVLRRLYHDPELRRRLAGWAPLAARNDYSLEIAHRTLVLALIDQGWGEASEWTLPRPLTGLAAQPRGLSLGGDGEGRPDSLPKDALPALVEPPRFSPGSGFSPRLGGASGATPAGWGVAPGGAEFVLESAAPLSGVLSLGFRPPGGGGGVLELWQGPAIAAVAESSAAASGGEGMMVAAVRLVPGVNRFTLRIHSVSSAPLGGGAEWLVETIEFGLLSSHPALSR
ncbi:MAG: glycosyltransferase, partial [Magnetococcales bacterium]|nr:glycosyltransferase [Magnetococcales bacterium]